jgi:Predicted nucleotide-binding protein containing TIR-like domain
LIWAPNDVTESKGESKASPRDNVVFECGLFMGALGRDRVFIICDQSISLKIQLTFSALTRLATYGGDVVEAGVRTACDRIIREIQRPRFPTIVGEWRSRYALAAEPGHQEVIEDVEINLARGGVSIVSKQDPAGDTTWPMVKLSMRIRS